MASKTRLRLIVIRSCLILTLTVAASIFLGRLFPQLGMWAQVLCVGIGSSIVVPMWIEYTNRSRDR